MPLLKEALFTDESGCLRMGPSALLVRDGDDVPVRVVSDATGTTATAWPVFGLRCDGQAIVGFLSRSEATEASVWQLDETGKCRAKHIPEARVMRLLLACAGTRSAEETATGPARATPPEWLEQRLAMFSTEETVTSLRPAAESPDWLLNLLKPQLAQMNADVHGLVTWLESSSHTAGKAGEILHIWQRFCAQFLGRLERSTEFFDALRNQAGYQLLREIAAAFVGRHLLRCPFTGTYQWAGHVRHITHRGPSGRATGGARVLRYDLAPGLWFHEIRGHGFLAQTDALVTGDGLLVQPALEDAWSSWLTPEACALYPGLPPSSSECPDPKMPFEVLVLNTAAGPNLGHLLWNDCSGLAGVLALARTLPAEHPVRRWQLALLPSSDQRFARDDHSAFIRGSLERLAAVDSGDAAPTTGTTLRNFESEAALAAYLATPRCIAISLKSLVVSPGLAASMRAEAERIPLPEALSSLESFLPDTLGVFVNVRLHDKALLNISECLEEAVARAQRQGWSPGNLLFVLEGTEEAVGKLCELSQALAARGARTVVAAGLGVEVLAVVISRCQVAIAPIGSGAVLPTWIYDRPTFLHADRAHMPQAGFWAHVGGSPENLIVIDTAHIHDVEDRLYSSYSIAPEVFADCFLRLLDRHKAINA